MASMIGGGSASLTAGVAACGIGIRKFTGSAKGWPFLLAAVRELALFIFLSG
jgi:hypothetical protein